MEYFVGLDVSLETVNVCIVNAAGDISDHLVTATTDAAVIVSLTRTVAFRGGRNALQHRAISRSARAHRRPSDR